MSYFSRVKSVAKERVTKPSSWKLEKHNSSLAPEGVWTNVDNDVTPVERRTWTPWTIMGFWFSDALNMQGWEAPSSILAVGLTYREAIATTAVGMLIISIPLVLNGFIGSTLHVPFPVAIRSSFGYQFGKVAVIIRFITACFWHSIQTYTGSYAMTNIIAAIWPSYLRIQNHIPENIGITTQGMVSMLVFWLVQFPFLMISPHKLRYFFIFKGVVVTICLFSVAAGMCSKAGTGELFKQEYKVFGSERSWFTLSCIMSNVGGWATMATNIADFTRYSKGGKSGNFLQALMLPVLSVYGGVMGILSTSAGGVLYGSYIWDPSHLALQWTGPGGRCAMFFVGFSWVLGQIGTNLSANVITAANDLTSLCPQYINIRRGAVIVAIIGGWVMQPWKIITSASSLLTFMSGLAIFLAPVAAIQAADFHIVKRYKVDVPALYDPHGRYEYWHGINWRALVALLCSLGPNIPGLANAVSGYKLPAGILHVYDMNYLYGFISAMVIYVALSKFFPDERSLVDELILADGIILEAAEGSADESTDEPEKLS